jgi:hypothetical protein
MDYGRGKSGSFGQIMGQSVVSAMETMLMVGGFIVLFTVIIGVLDEAGLFALFGGTESSLLSKGVAAGFIEVASGINNLDGIGRGAMVAAAGIVSWGGMCIHAQSLGYIGKTDIGAFSYLTGKVLHAVFAVLFGFIFYPMYERFGIRAVETAAVEMPQRSGAMANALEGIRTSGFMFAAALFSMIMFGIIIYFATKPQKIHKKRKKA